MLANVLLFFHRVANMIKEPKMLALIQVITMDIAIHRLNFEQYLHTIVDLVNVTTIQVVLVKEFNIFQVVSLNTKENPQGMRRWTMQGR